MPKQSAIARLRRALPFALPDGHFMAFAPLDTWVRLLFFPFAFVPPRYWLRLAAAVFTSFFGTVATLPERLVLAPILFFTGRRARHTLAHEPGLVIVLGHFRSGTTHLHNLLSCDRRFATPRWFHTLAPQGFVLSWSFLRLFLVPFLANSRPQDDVPFGPEWPAEDDFACLNWGAASSLPGKMVVPSRWDHYKRFHSLAALTPGERARWRRLEWCFLWKFTLLARGRRLLLKSPSHTARVKELLSILTPQRVKFVHISRGPVAVVRSNIAMHERMLELYGLQDAPSPLETERRVVDEYVESETRYMQDKGSVPPGQLAEVRYEDLVADPVGELRRIYAELDLGWSEELNDGVCRYLAKVGEYRAATPASAALQTPTGALAPLGKVVAWFRHDHPAKPAVPFETPVENPDARRRERLAWAVAPLIALVGGSAWLALGLLMHNRLDWLIWPTGVAVGWGAISTARVGTMGLGIYAAALTSVVLVAVEVAMTYLIYQGESPWALWEIWKTTSHEMLSEATLPWEFAGVVSALRFASRKHVHPPGR